MIGASVALSQSQHIGVSHYLPVWLRPKHHRALALPKRKVTSPSYTPKLWLACNSLPQCPSPSKLLGASGIKCPKGPNRHFSYHFSNHPKCVCVREVLQRKNTFILRFSICDTTSCLVNHLVLSR